MRCAGGAGNLLLYVGPMPTGEIEPRQATRLREIGAWLKKNGQAVYATRGGPFPPAPWGATTHAGNRIYVHILDWPQETVTLPGLRAKMVNSTVLTGGTARVKQTKDGVAVSVPASERDAIDTIVVLELDRPASNVP